jgi:hypothetical protein
MLRIGCRLIETRSISKWLVEMGVKKNVPKAIDPRVLAREYICECGTVDEVLVQNLFQLRVRDAVILAPNPLLTR